MGIFIYLLIRKCKMASALHCSCAKFLHQELKYPELNVSVSLKLSGMDRKFEHRGTLCSVVVSASVLS